MTRPLRPAALALVSMLLLALPAQARPLVGSSWDEPAGHDLGHDVARLADTDPRLARLVAARLVGDTDAASDRRPSPDRHRRDRPSPTGGKEHDLVIEHIEVAEAGVVTIAHDASQAWLRDVVVEDGWRHRVQSHGPERVIVGFSDGEQHLVLWAVPTREGLRHGVKRVEDRPDVRTGSWEVEPAGLVELAWTDDSFVDVRVRENEGWMHRVHRPEPNKVMVGFTDGDVWIVFGATVHDGRVETATHRWHCDRDEPRTSEQACGPTAGT